MKRVSLALLLVLATGLALRLAFLRVHQTIERDGVLYASVAEHLARSGRLIDLRGQYHTFYPPGYPALVAPVYALLGDSHRAGQVVSLAAGMALILLVFLVGARVAGPGVGLVAAALTAIYPPLVHEAVSVHTESSYAALLGLLLLAGLALLARPGPGRCALAGLLVGALYLVRPEGILLASVFGWLLVVWLRRGERLPVVAARAAAFACALLLLVVPYVAYLHRVTGAWLLSGKGLSYSIAESPAEFDAIAFGPARSRPWRGFRAEGSALAERYLRNAFRQEGAIAESVSLLALGLAAVGLAALARRRTAGDGVLLCAFVPLLLYPAFEVVARWTEPYMVVLFIFAARGVAEIAAAAPERWRAAVVAGALVGLLALRWGPQLAIPLRYVPAFEPVELVDAGRWVEERFGPGEVVMSRAPEVAYYARGRWVALPYAPIPGVVEAARRAGVGALVIDELNMRRLRPELLPLLEGPPPPGLTLLHQTDRFPQRRVRVFAVAAP